MHCISSISFMVVGSHLLKTLISNSSNYSWWSNLVIYIGVNYSKIKTNRVGQLGSVCLLHIISTWNSVIPGFQRFCLKSILDYS